MKQSFNTTSINDGPLLYFYGRFVLRLCQLAMGIACAMLIMDLLIIGLAIPMRYLFSKPIIWADEVIALSLTSIVMLAAPEVLRRNGHIGVDIFTSYLPKKYLIWAQIWAHLSVVSMAGILIFNGWHTAMFAKMIGRLTEGHLELPVWLLQLLLPIGGCLLFLVTIEHLWRSLRQLFSQPPLTP